MQYRMFLAAALSATALGAVSNSEKPNKPALTDDLNYLEQGNLDNLHPTDSDNGQAFAAGQLPADCKTEAQNNSQDPADIEAYKVTYNDCGDSWTICRHKSSPVDLITTIDKFGRLPISMRDWTRHVITLPDTAAHAYNSNGNVVLFGTAAGDMDVFVHEVGHSLDLLGGLTSDGSALSAGDAFQNAVAADANVPDNYAGTNYIEDMAQNIVVSVYDKNVPNGFCGVQSNCAAIQNQYTTVEGAAGSQIVPGGQCDRHLQDSATVCAAASRMMARGHPGYVEFAGNYTNIVGAEHPNWGFSTKDICHNGI